MAQLLLDVNAKDDWSAQGWVIYPYNFQEIYVFLKDGAFYFELV